MAEIHKLEFAQKKSLFELSIETKLIFDHLRSFAVEQFATYAELSALIGRDVQQEGRGHLSQAVKKCLREHGVIFGTVRNQGVKRLADKDALEGGKIYDRVTSMINRRRAVLHALDYPQLTKQQQVSHNAELTSLGTAKFFMKQKTIAQLESAVETRELPVAKTLALFNK